MKGFIGQIINKFENGNKTIIQIEMPTYQAKMIEIKEYQFKYGEIKEQRSIQQNKLLWDIIGEIAKTQHEDDLKIYCDLLESTNCSYQWLIGLDEIEPILQKNFRVVRKTRYQEINGKQFAVYKCYEGSSKYNVEEMNLLIEEALNRAYDLGVRISYEK